MRLIRNTVTRIRGAVFGGRKSQLRRNFATTALCNAVNVVLVLIAYRLYLHYLGYRIYGLWVVLSTVIGFTQLTSFGMGSAVMTLVAEAKTREDRETIREYVSSSLSIMTVLGGAAWLLLTAGRPYIIRLFGIDSSDAGVVGRLLPLSGLLTAYALSVQIWTATVAGLGRMDLSASYDTTGRATALLTSSALLTRGAGLLSLICGSFAGLVVVHALSWQTARRISGGGLLSRRGIRRNASMRVLRFGGGMFLSSLVQMFLAPFNRVVLSRNAGIASLPVFDIAYNGTMQVRGLFESGFRAFVPQISAARARGEQLPGGEISIARRGRGVIARFGGPVWIALLLLSPIGLRLWLGNQFVAALPGTVDIMFIGAFLSLLGVPSFYLLVGFCRTDEILISTIIQSAVNVCMVISFGTLGLTISPALVAATVGIGMAASTFYLINRERFVLAAAPSVLQRPTDLDAAREPLRALHDEE